MIYFATGRLENNPHCPDLRTILNSTPSIIKRLSDSLNQSWFYLENNSFRLAILLLIFRGKKNLLHLSDLSIFKKSKLGKTFSSGNCSATFADVDANLTLKRLFTGGQMRTLLCLINFPHKAHNSWSLKDF